MKQEIIDQVVNRMAEVLTGMQLQELKMAMVIALEGYTVTKEQTELSTEVIDNYAYMAKYLQSLAVSGHSQGTIDNYKLALTQLFEDIKKPVTRITDDDLLQHLAHQKVLRHIGNRYLSSKRTVFRQFFSWMCRRKYMMENPAMLLDQIKWDSVIKKPYSDEEREKIRCSCKRERDLALVDVLYSTAARVSEIAALNRVDIDFHESGCIVHGKGGKERPVYLNATAAYHLRMYLDSRTDDNPALFVSCHTPFGRLGKTGIEAILRRLGKSAGVENVHPHRFRRTALTNALNRGMPLQDAQIMAGHSTPNTTMIYCKVDQNKVKSEHKMYLAS